MKLIDPRKDDPGCMGAVQINTEQSAWIRGDVTQCGLRIVQLTHDVNTSLVERLPVQGRSYLASRSFQQPRIEPSLELLDGVRGDGSPDIEPVGTEL